MNDRTSALATVIDDGELIDVLCSSLYPGASRESAGLVLGYCRAAQLDPMLKPVHIVPMRVKLGTKNNYGDDEYGMKDTIMPGIGLYRVQAARTGQYAGQDIPEFGPTETMTYQQKKVEWVAVPGRDKKQKRESFVEKTLEFPQWCAVTIYRLVGGFRVAFVAVEYWTENYATAGRDSEAPNEMWAKRTRGQLAKCAEAQALRKAFPEVGSQPTGEEMEGRYVQEVAADPAPEFTQAVQPRRASETQAAIAQDTAEPFIPSVTGVVAEPVIQTRAEPAAAPAPAPAAAPASVRTDTQPAGEPASEGERKNVIITAKARKFSLGDILLDMGMKLNPETLEGLTKPQFKALKAKLA